MKTETSLQSIKAYLFPTVVSILSMMIWYDVTEIKKDLKVLMAQSNVDKTRIDHIEKEMDRLQSSRRTSSLPMNNEPLENRKTIYTQFILDLPRKRYDDFQKKPYNHA